MHGVRCYWVTAVWGHVVQGLEGTEVWERWGCGVTGVALSLELWGNWGLGVEGVPGVGGSLGCVVVGVTGGLGHWVRGHRNLG